MKWKLESVNGEKPPPRYGHSQVHIDETHLMIMGNQIALLSIDIQIRSRFCFIQFLFF